MPLSYLFEKVETKAQTKAPTGNRAYVSNDSMAQNFDTTFNIVGFPSKPSELGATPNKDNYLTQFLAPLVQAGDIWVSGNKTESKKQASYSDAQGFNVVLSNKWKVK